MYSFKLEKFEGPLDLLLNLIEEEKFNISEISLSHVTDDFLQYIETHPQISPEELADFLVVATKLLLLKSKLLVPDLPMDPEDDPSSLAGQLKIYKEYLLAMKNIQGIIAAKKFFFWRQKAPVSLKPTFSPGQQLNSEKLKVSFLEILKALEKMVILPESVMVKTVSLQEKIIQIKNLIKTAAQFSFKKIVQSAQSRTELIVSFLALLELVKQQEIHVHQEDNFSDIMIKSANHA